MKNFIPSWLRVLVLFFAVFGLIEYFVDSGNEPAFLKYPLIMLYLLLVLLFLIGVEAIVAALENILFKSLTETQKQSYLAKQTQPLKIVVWTQTTYKKLLGSKPLEEEHEIILDHNYDGIKELDNDLPPWWLYGFYASIIFGLVYMVRYHVFNGDDQYTELKTEYAEAEIAIEEYKKTAKNLVDFKTVTVLTDASDINSGKAIFTENCIPCHMADGGGGIGPNLTDKYWILGGGIKNVFKTISEGGRYGKGMIAWKQNLKPAEMAQVASYVLTLEGTTPANPKEAEGAVWTSEKAPMETIPTEAIEVKTDSVILIESD
ncbi:c-type cytochrome [Lacinutrix neustonica]|uniref:C-type cytochrome n=1 Tax=Lacinutrix neustonica TaxID=2980107 RepID=A0A9E8SEH2_9FLAO|nr:cbb3-type cytochrome c oxidase N-terminal domain-containing protein [Lacinutrix neustonica]WAC02329.1 c-type cytochrome [Lacinutrix neustonica]